MKLVKILSTIMLIATLIMSASYAEDRVSLGYISGWTGDYNLVDRTKGGINQVSPTCLDLDSNGNLVVTNNLTHEFVEAMHEREVKVTPFLSNHWNRKKGIKAVENAEALTDQLIDVVNEYNLDGINVDIENLTVEYKDAFSDFVILLNKKLPEEKILSVAVAANPFGKDTGWAASYDYAKLGDNSDYVFLMTYDEHSQGGMLGPVSSHEFVERSIIYARDYIVKDKLVLGIPLYGRYWKYDEEDETYYGGKAAVAGAIDKLYAALGGQQEYDIYLGESKYAFTVDNSVASAKINGEELEDGQYVMYYPSNEAIKDKLDLVNKYDLLGSGVWALGFEKSEVWDYYKDELNKTPRIIKAEIEDTEEQFYEYASITYDLTPINNMIFSDRTRVDIDYNFNMNDLNVEAEQFMMKEDIEEVSVIDEAKSVEKDDSKNKKMKALTNNVKKLLHHMRTEKKY